MRVSDESTQLSATALDCSDVRFFRALEQNPWGSGFGSCHRCLAIPSKAGTNFDKSLFALDLSRHFRKLDAVIEKMGREQLQLQQQNRRKIDEAVAHVRTESAAQLKESASRNSKLLQDIEVRQLTAYTDLPGLSTSRHGPTRRMQESHTLSSASTTSNSPTVGARYIETPSAVQDKTKTRVGTRSGTVCGYVCGVQFRQATFVVLCLHSVQGTQSLTTLTKENPQRDGSMPRGGALSSVPHLRQAPDWIPRELSSQSLSYSPVMPVAGRF